MPQMSEIPINKMTEGAYTLLKAEYEWLKKNPNLYKKLPPLVKPGSFNRKCILCQGTKNGKHYVLKCPHTGNIYQHNIDALRCPIYLCKCTKCGFIQHNILSDEYSKLQKVKSKKRDTGKCIKCKKPWKYSEN